MTHIAPQQLSTPRSPEDVWRGINVPLSGELGQTVNPYAVVDYEGLHEDMVGEGTLVVYRPNLERLEPALGMIAGFLPKDVAMRVTEHDPENRRRLDVLESDKHSGFITHEVQEVDGSALLVVHGELAIGGSKKMFEGTIVGYAEQGIAEHSRRVLEHLDVILDSKP